VSPTAPNRRKDKKAEETETLPIVKVSPSAGGTYGLDVIFIPDPSSLATAKLASAPVLAAFATVACISLSVASLAFSETSSTSSADPVELAANNEVTVPTMAFPASASSVVPDETGHVTLELQALTYQHVEPK
jgi:hypothetical protein